MVGAPYQHAGLAKRAGDASKVAPPLLAPEAAGQQYGQIQADLLVGRQTVAAIFDSGRVPLSFCWRKYKPNFIQETCLQEPQKTCASLFADRVAASSPCLPQEQTYPHHANAL